jgi:predicted nuclease of predicted toxin-antitoxin system
MSNISTEELTEFKKALQTFQTFADRLISQNTVKTEVIVTQEAPLDETKLTLNTPLEAVIEHVCADPSKTEMSARKTVTRLSHFLSNKPIELVIKDSTLASLANFDALQLCDYKYVSPRAIAGLIKLLHSYDTKLQKACLYPRLGRYLTNNSQEQIAARALLNRVAEHVEVIMNPSSTLEALTRAVELCNRALRPPVKAKGAAK